MKFLGIVFLQFFLLIPVCLAGDGAIRGTVTDPSGAVIPGAAVQLVAKDVKVETRTNANGEFTILPGRRAEGERSSAGDEYTITADASGFTPVTQTVQLSQLAGGRITLVLEVAPYRQAVDVGSRRAPFNSQLDMTGLRESPARDVGEALATLDGVWKIRKGGIANDVVVRGFQQNNINVLVDGSRTYGACPNHMDPPAQHIDFAEVDRVEVTKGAFDVANEGSLGAMVNVVTKKPSLGFSVKPSFSAGSFGYYNPSVVASYGNRTFRILGGYAYRTSDPYKDGSGKRFTEYTNYSTTGSQKRAFDINTGWIDTELALSDRQELALSYTRQESGLILYPYLTMDSEYDNADRAKVKYSAKALSGALRNVRAEVYLTQVIHFMTNAERTAAVNDVWTMAANASTHTLGGRVEGDLGRDWTVGVESYHWNWNVMSTMRSTLMTSALVPDVDLTSLGSFASYHHTVGDKLKIAGGLRFDHGSMEVTAPGASTALYYQYHNTRKTSNQDNYASGNIRLSRSLPKSLEVFVGAGTTGRMPSAVERYFSRRVTSGVTVGDPTLPVTRNTEVDAGMNFTHQRGYIRPELFYSDLDNYIIVNNQPLLNTGVSTFSTARSFTNVDARIYGGELAYGVSFTNEFSFAGGTSYSRGTVSRRAEANVLSSHLPEMPPLRLWGALRYAHRWAYAEFGGTAVDRQGLVDTDLKETATAGYGLLNLKLGFTHKKFSGSFTMDNLLNHFYYEHLSYYRDPFSAGAKIPEPGRNFFVQLRYSF